MAYFVTKVAIMRANHVVFPISPRNSSAAIAHLIHKANIKHVLVGHDHFMQSLVQDALQILKSQHQTVVLPTTSSMLTFDQLFLEKNRTKPFTNDLPYKFRGPDAHGLILHSSGPPRIRLK